MTKLMSQLSDRELSASAEKHLLEQNGFYVRFILNPCCSGQHPLLPETTGVIEYTSLIYILIAKERIYQK